MDPAGADRLDADRLRGALRTWRLGRTLHVLAETTSTNAVALDLGLHGADDGTVVVADTQTAGRGRLGRRWFSPPGEGVYCSVLLRPEAWGTAASLVERLSWVPLVCALAAAGAIERVTGRSPGLKWPNDLLLDDRKIGGLLCESGPRSGTDRPVPAPPLIVVGIGVNVNTTAFPPELEPQATSLAQAAGGRIDRARLLVELLAELESHLGRLPGTPLPELVEAYTRACVTLGRRVRVDLPGDETITGLAESIGLDGALRIRCTEGHGTFIDVRAGDVIHVR